jgi:hypothetical protein
MLSVAENLGDAAIAGFLADIMAKAEGKYILALEKAQAFNDLPKQFQ